MQLPKLLLLLTRLMASISQALPGRSPDSARRAWRRAGIARAVLITILYSQGEVSPGIDSIMSPLVFPSALGRLRRRFLFFLFHATLRKKSRILSPPREVSARGVREKRRDAFANRTRHAAYTRMTFRAVIGIRRGHTSRGAAGNGDLTAPARVGAVAALPHAPNTHAPHVTCP